MKRAAESTAAENALGDSKMVPTNAVETEEKRKTQVPESQPPVSCRLIPERGMFRVIKAKGKTLSSGGFGVAISEEIEIGGFKGDKQNNGKELKNNATSSISLTEEKTSESQPTMSTKESFDHLFIEEVLFLHERGLLQCFPPTDHPSKETPLESSQLYQMLPRMGMSLPMYFVYAHLRSQDFRVLRHAPSRLTLLLQQKEANLDRRETRELRRRVRESIQKAPPPEISPNVGGAAICWDAYQPDSNFAKTSPGLPSFYVAVTYYHHAQVSFTDIQSLVLNNCHGITLKLATVSDSGTVVMFGLTNFGVPSISKKMVTSKDDE